MNLLDKVTTLLPFGKPQEYAEYFFALNINPENLKVCLWTIEGSKLEIFNLASANYSSNDEIIQITDKLLDQVLGEKQIEPEKILFGVPDAWLLDDNLKDPYLQLLRSIVKGLELKPMAYVSSSHAICHFLEKVEGVPSTAILVGVGESEFQVTVVRGGKIDGTKFAKRSDNLGEDIEKLLMLFTEVEVLPSRMLLFSLGKVNLDKQKSDLLSFPWMNRLSFLHLPKIDSLQQDIEIQSVAFAGAFELNPDVKYTEAPPVVKGVSTLSQLPKEEESPTKQEDLGFVTGDVTKKDQITDEKEQIEIAGKEVEISKKEISREGLDEGSDEYEEREMVHPPPGNVQELESTISKRLKFLQIFHQSILRLVVSLMVLILLIAGYIFLPQAKVTIFVEPRILEKDTQVTADPKVKEVDEVNKKIPGQIVETQVSGSEKGSATGRKQVGESAKGAVIITNKTFSSKTFAKGTVLSTSDNLKFTLDSAVTVASQSATEDGISFGKTTGNISASSIGADGNIPSGTQLSISGIASTEFSARAEGNFSGGTSKDVTVISDSDQKKLLATLASTFRKQAQEKIQAKLEGKKILEEALSEEVVKKSFSKNINDQATEFSLNLTINYKGTAYLDDDLKRIVAKLVETNIPEDFELNLADTETQADVSKVEKDGKLIFLARFRAKLMPKIDEGKIRQQIKWKTPQQAAEILKSYENVLGSEIKMSPSFPSQLARLPFLNRNIKIEVKLK